MIPNGFFGVVFPPVEPPEQQLFNCQALRKLSIPDNDLSSLPTSIASLVNLRELDISKNGEGSPPPGSPKIKPDWELR
ncbi:hypothetical protein DV515_00014687 [Chloebia gouldiae]|uniref:Uncharacterized protein n=1 Tax=Chloebia gouldiae TaxID=44316 RepID=A0A3L8RXA8_CHLGU|nr:hypothetical protein DV515_00014687 [Chloebia gouldiae]